MNADVLVSPQGSIVLFDLLSAAAEGWVEEHIDPDAQWFGGALVVEHRYAGDLALALERDGLAVEVL
jgi:hypothetical protein